MKTVIFFDGVCNLCNGIIQWLIEHDHHDRFRFAPLQSELGSRLLEDTGEPNLDSIIVVQNGRRYVKSDAALLIARKLGSYYRWFNVLSFLPKHVRDRGYDLIARNRKQIFGERESCMVPTPDLQRKFLNLK